MLELRGKEVLVTGAARGMGRLEAINFARPGCRVAVTDVDEAGLARTASAIKYGIEI